MPISFLSKTHGQIPVGFFNIDTDMLLLDRYFFFSTDFCEWVMEWSLADGLDRDEKTVYLIRRRESIGNLAGAIHGYEFSGFIGEVYKLFPFPKTRSGFKQKPLGTQRRSTIESTIQPFAESLKIQVVFDRESRTVSFGEYGFGAGVFRDILRYIEAGGMPGWLQGQPPDYVAEMMTRLAMTPRWPFHEPVP